MPEIFSCDHCINAITKAVTALEGVKSVDGSPDTKQVTVVFDPSKVSQKAIAEAMEAEGYPVAI